MGVALPANATGVSPAASKGGAPDVASSSGSPGSGRALPLVPAPPSGAPARHGGWHGGGRSSSAAPGLAWLEEPRSDDIRLPPAGRPRRPRARPPEREVE